MSWDSYIDNCIAQSKTTDGTAHIDKVIILGMQDGASWTTAGHANAFRLQPDECQNISKACRSKDYSNFMSGGIFCEGNKYQFLRTEESTVLGKKKGIGAITISPSKTAVVVVHVPEGGQHGNANKAAAVISDYLSSMNM